MAMDLTQHWFGIIVSVKKLAPFRQNSDGRSADFLAESLRISIPISLDEICVNPTHVACLPMVSIDHPHSISRIIPFFQICSLFVIILDILTIIFEISRICSFSKYVSN